jgi:MFS family permease
MIGQREAAAGLQPVQIAALTASFLCGAVQFWMMPPLTALLLERGAAGTFWIGVAGSMPWIGLVVVVPLIARSIERYGIQRTYQAGIVLTALVLVGFLSTGALAAWLLLNTMLGIGLGLRWIATDAFVTGAAPEAQRGVLLGAYETLVAGAIGLGPLVLALTGTGTWLPYGVALLLLLVQMAGSFALPARPIESHAEPWWRSAQRVARADPSILVAAFLCGVLEGIATSVLPVYGVRSGLTGESAALLVTAMGVGIVALQIPLGFLAQRLALRAMYAMTGAAITVLGVLAPLTIGATLPAWTLLALWGGLAAGLYLYALIRAGRIFAGATLVHAVAGVAVTYTAGGALGPVLGSVGLALHPTAGMPGVLGLTAALGTLVLVILTRPAPAAAAG